MISEYADALPLLDAALADLAKGQLIADKRYPMMELMAAIEINDARTDTYLASQKEREKQRPPLPRFDAGRGLLSQEVLWIADEVVRLEATFHDGSPLASTLWTCNYFRPSSLSSLSGFSPPSPSSSSRQKPLRTVVLRALLLGTLKCSEIVWEELCKGHVMEHEDVHLSLSSLPFNTLMASCFPSPPPPVRSPLALPGQQQPEAPQETVVSVDDVLRALDEALRWLQDEEREEDEVGEEGREGLRVRVLMRIDLLYLLAYLTAPHYTSPLQLTHHLSRLSSYSSLLPCPSSPPSTFSPSPEVRSAFSPSAPSLIPLLATQQPPRPVTPLPAGEAYGKIVGELGEDVKGLVGLWEACENAVSRAGGTGGADEVEVWRLVREWTKERGRKEASPYVRSLHQSLITPPSALLFSRLPPSSLSLSFLSSLFLLPPSSSFSSTLLATHSCETSPSSPAHLALAYLERLAVHFLLPTTVGCAGQNRGRQRRIVVKSARKGAFAGVLREAEEVGVEGLLAFAGSVEEKERLRKLPLAVAAHVLEVTLHALLSGFEDGVGLFDREGGGDGGEGREQAWWVGGKVAEKLDGLWATLGAGGKEEGGYVKAKKEEARALSLLHPLPLSRRSNPFLSSLAPPASKEAIEAGRFAQRFDWLDGLTGVAEVEGMRWEGYREERRMRMGEEPAALAAEAKASFSSALSALTAFASVPLAERGANVRPELGLKRLANLRRVASRNEAHAAAFSSPPKDREEGKKGRAKTEWENEGAWFPYWSQQLSE
ncbi:hypothetical protein JCM8547_001227 [Rhodosporidiobolus lusitaniae]